MLHFTIRHPYILCNNLCMFVSRIWWNVSSTIPCFYAFLQCSLLLPVSHIPHACPNCKFAQFRKGQKHLCALDAHVICRWDVCIFLWSLQPLRLIKKGCWKCSRKILQIRPVFTVLNQILARSALAHATEFPTCLLSSFQMAQRLNESPRILQIRPVCSSGA